MARALTELCGPQLKVASKGMVQCQPCHRFSHIRTETAATNLSVLLLARHLWGDYTTSRWLLRCCGCKASRRKIHREGWHNNSGMAAKAAALRRLPWTEDRFCWNQVVQWGGVGRASTSATKKLASNPVRGLHRRQFLWPAVLEGLAAADWKSAGQSRLPGKGGHVLSANCAQHFSATLNEFFCDFPWLLGECQGIIQTRGRARNPRLPSHWSLASDVFCTEVSAGYKCSDVQGHCELHRHNLNAYSAYCESHWGCPQISCWINLVSILGPSHQPYFCTCKS
jgi:hypothetical protein